MAGRPPQERVIDTYTHEEYKRINNPMAGVAQYDTEETSETQYTYDPHIDPTLEWAGKDEHEQFVVPTSSIHIHESIKPSKIISSLQKEQADTDPLQGVLFGETVQEETARRTQAIEFYKHGVDWTNRLIAGDSLTVMNSLLQKEGMGGQVQMVYIDPPYGINYKSNFQVTTNNTSVSSVDKDSSIDSAPEQITAFRDTWELGIHSYLTYLRDRIKLAHELLADSGSIFIQISNANVHFIRNLCDEVFGYDNFMSQISYATTSGAGSPNALTSLSSVTNYLVWYAKDKSKVKYHQLYREKSFGGDGSSSYGSIELSDGTRMSISEWEKSEKRDFDYAHRPYGSRVFSFDNLKSQSSSNATSYEFEYKGVTYSPGKSYWKTNREGMERLIENNRIGLSPSGSIYYIRYFDDFPYYPITNMWNDVSSSFMEKYYVVQTNSKIIERCMLMCTDPGDLVLDPTCGSGTTAYVAEKWGRRWITIDTSRVAIEVAKKRLMCSTYDYYKLADPDCGVDDGLLYEQAQHVTLRSIARGEEPESEILYDRPLVDKTRIRVSGPFTVEAVPSPVVISPSDEVKINFGDEEQLDWQEELKATGILDRNGNRIRFSRVDMLEGTDYLQAEAETDEEEPRRAVICFGSVTKPMDRRIVDRAMDEASVIKPRPQLLIFAAFQFDPEAGDLINSGVLPGVTCLEVQMNPDLLVTDLKKKQRSSQSFYMVGQPDVELLPLARGKNKWKVELNGFDYYDMKSGAIISGSSKNIAMWMLDEDYDGMCFEPEQVFFPRSAGGWGSLAKSLKAEIDPARMKAYEGTTSLPFTALPDTRIAVKIVDERGTESIRVITVKEQ